MYQLPMCIQVPLDQRVQQDIVTELKTPKKLREALDVVEIVMALLSSEGGNPKFTLNKYLHRMKKKPFSSMVCDLIHCLF